MRETFRCLIDGVPDGMTMVAGILSWRAEYATPWAWLPVLVQPGTSGPLPASFTSGAGHHSLPSVPGVHMGHSVVGAPQLKAEDRLKILTLQQYFAFESIAEVDGRGQGRFFDNIVDPGSKNEA